MTSGRLGAYELVRQVARGGMADIFLARTEHDDHVALKVLSPYRTSDADACALFEDEARLVALLDHPNLARVIDVGTTGDRQYLAMEYVHGVDLRELLSTACRAHYRVPFEAALSIVCAAAAGLDHAHRSVDPHGRPLRLVHRDVSLSNIMVTHDGVVKVVDFGIARSAIATVQTSPGTVRGKASYMAPEQCLGDPVDHRADVFALGIVLYELTTGTRCFAGASDFDRMVSIVRGEYTPPTELVADYPVELEQVIRRALATDAGQRFQSAGALIEALQRVAVARLWVTGTSAIIRVVHDLFGVVPLPWVSEPAVLPLPQLPTKILRIARGTEPPPPVLARGSEPDLRRTLGPVDDDDEPTRGRRAIKRPPTAPVLAA